MDIKDIITKIEQGNYKQLSETEMKQAIAFLQQQNNDLEKNNQIYSDFLQYLEEKNQINN